MSKRPRLESKHPPHHLYGPPFLLWRCWPGLMRMSTRHKSDPRRGIPRPLTYV